MFAFTYQSGKCTTKNPQNIAPSDSAAFYWTLNNMAFEADKEHNLERISGGHIYYRSPTFWRTSAAVNLPGSINNLYSASLNNFDTRCHAYTSCLSILTELKFPNTQKQKILELPEGWTLRKINGDAPVTSTKKKTTVHKKK